MPPPCSQPSSPCQPPFILPGIPRLPREFIERWEGVPGERGGPMEGHSKDPSLVRDV